MAPAHVPCDYAGDAVVNLQVTGIPQVEVSTALAEVSDAESCLLDVLHSRAWDDSATAWLMHRLWTCAEEPNAPHARLVLEGGATMLLGELMRLADSPLPTVHDRSRLSNPVMNRLDEYLHERLGGSVGMAELASLAGCTRHHFSRLFLNTTGETPHGYLTRLRIERAEVLLSTTALPIDVVAQRVGFGHR